MQQQDIDLRARIYDEPVNGRHSPRKGELAQAMNLPIAEVDASLRRLAEAHMIVLQPQTGEVLMANPFSAVPTPFLVRSADRSWYANCIWDGMGISAMLHKPVDLQTSCACCGDEIQIRIPDDCKSNDERVAHFAIPAAHWWDDIVFN